MIISHRISGFLTIAPLVALAATSAPTMSSAAPTGSAGSTNAPSMFYSTEDGWLDISEFVDQAYGFVPIAMPITEPAIGYGAAGGLMFIDKPQEKSKAGFGRPNLTVAGGMATENGTWMVAAGDVRHWKGDRLQTLVGAAYGSINLDFYGIGKSGSLESLSLNYNMQPVVGLAQAKYRLGDSRCWVGLGYTLGVTQIEFDAPSTAPGLPEFKQESRIGGVTPKLSYDSRDTLFTPTRGTYAEATAELYSEALGGQDEFQRTSLLAMHYMPLHPKWTLGVKGNLLGSFGNAPFYMRPFVMMRGVEAMRYQGEDVAQIEAEVRWQFWKRFSVVGFAGTGAAWNDFEEFDQANTVAAGGTGFRYELARKYGLHMGLDVAFGPDDPVIYVQFGSAWMRP